MSRPETGAAGVAARLLARAPARLASMLALASIAVGAAGVAAGLLARAPARLASMLALASIAVGAAGLTAGCRDPVSAEVGAESDSARRDGGPAATAGGPQATAERGYVAVVSAREATDVTAELAGRMTAVHVQLGDMVEAGQLVAELDDRQVREDLAVAVAAQRAARAALEQARVEVAEAARTLETERALMEQGTTSRSEFDRARFAHDKAVASRSRAEAALAEQDALVAGLRSRLTQTRITAPYAGTVSTRYLDPGTFVSPGTAILRLIASDELWVKFAVPSEDARRVHVGNGVRVEIEPVGVSVKAVVRHVAPELEPASQMIIAEADLVLDEAAASLIKAGQAARVHLSP